MDCLDKKYGPISGRCWGLFLNFIFNALAIHGAIRYVIRGESPVEMYLGLILTAGACLVVAVPTKGD